MARCLVLLLAFVLLLGASVTAAAAEGKREYVQSLKEEAKTVLEEKGGKLMALENERLKEMGYCLFGVEVEPCAVHFPASCEAAYTCYVKEGELEWRSTLKGFPLPMGRVKTGELVMLPCGHANAIYNPGKDKACMVCLARFTPTEYKYLPDPPFLKLAGDSEKLEFQGVLKGFDVKTLASAYDIDEDLAKELKKKRNAIGFDFDKKCKEKGYDDEAYTEMTDGMRYFVCPLKQLPSLVEERGSCMKACMDKTWPATQKAGFSAAYTHLKKGTIGLPKYWNNVATVSVVIKGKMKLELVNTRGENVARKELKEGDMFIVPPAHADACIGDCEEDAEILTFAGDSCIKPTMLAGKENVYKKLKTHEGYLATVFDIDEKKACEIFEKAEDCAFAANKECGKEEGGKSSSFFGWAKE